MMKKKNELEFESDKVKVYVQQIQAVNGILAQQLDQLKVENEKLKQYKTSKQASYETMQREWNEAKNEVKQLKAENKQLEKSVRSNKDKRKRSIEQSIKYRKFACGLFEKYKQAVAEIKLLAYELTNEEYTDFIEEKQKQILQKCEEVK